MQTRLDQKIKAKLAKLNICLADNVDSIVAHSMQESVTNHFFRFNDIHACTYLIRINGKLWPPFTRDHEDFNLKRLSQYGIYTGVIYNSVKHGFQICRLDEIGKFSELPLTTRTSLLTEVGTSIEKLHQVKGFKNEYSIQNTIHHSFMRMNRQHQAFLSSHRNIIMSIIKVINSDSDNQVSSHNDLLPSSVYCRTNNVGFVDWEYASTNHRSYDLALFSVKASLSHHEEDSLLTGYDPEHTDKMKHTFVLMKSVISLLLLQWYITGKDPKDNVTRSLFLNLNENLRIAIEFQSIRSISIAVSSAFFKRQSRQKTIKKSQAIMLNDGISSSNDTSHCERERSKPGFIASL